MIYLMKAKFKKNIVLFVILCWLSGNLDGPSCPPSFLLAPYGSKNKFIDNFTKFLTWRYKQMYQFSDMRPPGESI